MKKKRINLWLLSALVCGLSLFTTACSDDNDGEQTDSRIVTEGGKTGIPDSLLTDQERYQLACQSAIVGTLHHLAGLDRLTADMLNQKHEPAYGESLDGEGSTVRAMKAQSAVDAELSFRAIAGLDSTDAARLFTATPDGLVLSLKDLPVMADGTTFSLGTLTFHRDGGPRRYGYVEVDIPCIPHLERIDYLAPEAFPDNANCPYQVGDVVRVKSGSGLCTGYYVCVANNGYRSTLCHMNGTRNPGGDESVNLDGDSEGCWYPYNETKGHTTTYDDVKDYVSFMVENQSKVANIKAFMEGKAANKKPSVSGKLWHLFPNGFNNDKGVVYSGSRAYIVYTSEWGEYYWIDGWIASGWDYRICRYAGIENGCTSRDQVWNGYTKYVYDKDWDNEWRGYSMFTMNVIHADGLVSDSELEYRAQ